MFIRKTKTHLNVTNFIILPGQIIIAPFKSHKMWSSWSWKLAPFSSQNPQLKFSKGYKNVVWLPVERLNDLFDEVEDDKHPDESRHNDVDLLKK